MNDNNASPKNQVRLCQLKSQFCFVSASVCFCVYIASSDIEPLNQNRLNCVPYILKNISLYALKMKKTGSLSMSWWCTESARGWLKKSYLNVQLVKYAKQKGNRFTTTSDQLTTPSPFLLIIRVLYIVVRFIVNATLNENIYFGTKMDLKDFIIDICWRPNNTHQHRLLVKIDNHFKIDCMSNETST